MELSPARRRVISCLRHLPIILHLSASRLMIELVLLSSSVRRNCHTPEITDAAEHHQARDLCLSVLPLSAHSNVHEQSEPRLRESCCYQLHAALRLQQMPTRSRSGARTLLCLYKCILHSPPFLASSLFYHSSDPGVTCTEIKCIVQKPTASAC